LIDNAFAIATMLQCQECYSKFTEANSTLLLALDWCLQTS
jgi:hypothetical protein